MQGYRQTPVVHESKDMRMWRCEDINKHPEYMNLRIWGCENVRIQVNTHKHKDIMMRGYKQVEDIKYADYF